MNAIRRKLALAQIVAVALLLGACGGGDHGDPSPVCANPAAPGCGDPPPASPVITNTPPPTEPPAVLNVTGGWRSLARSWNFSLKQDGANLSGVVVGFKNVSYDASDPAVQITGSIDSSGSVAFSAPVFGIEFSGIVEPGGLKIAGTLRDCAGGCRNYGEILEKK
jgi:hypothetical protein